MNSSFNFSLDINRSYDSSVKDMCRQNSCSHSEEETTTAEESLLIYCKPVELYNILRCRALHNPSFLQRCLHYKVQATKKKRLRTGVVVFNYRDYKSIIRKTEVTDDFSCPFCLMQCSSFKGLRYHLYSSHDLFNFEFWATEEYQSVNVSVRFDIMMSETVADGVDPQLQTFFFCSRPRRRKSRNSSQSQKHVNVQFLEMDAPTLSTEGIHRRNSGKEDDALSCKNEMDTKLFSHANYLKNGRRGIEFYDSDYPNMKGAEHVELSDNIPGVSIAMAQSSMDQECVNSLSVIDHTQPAKMRKLTAERADSKNRLLLQKRQFYHSHRVQPMVLDQVLSDTDSEDEVDDDIADFDDRRMLDDFVDVTKDEKKLMHLWNSFVRKQKVLADGHVSWACEAFSKLHGQELVSSPSLFWCWRLFMIKLWNHGLLDASTMNKCNATLEGFRDQPPNPINGLGSQDV